jgi:three-Cys-motif partner protein
MPTATEDFHEKAFDQGTLAKLRLFELYTRAWLPVFLSQADAEWTSVHVFDFFSGPGCDGRGEAGSPLRILRQLKDFETLPGWNRSRVHAHFFDDDSDKVDRLRGVVSEFGVSSRLELDIRHIDFNAALDEYDSILRDRRQAKLLFVDQFGVRAVTDPVFERMVSYPTSDFIFFLPSSYLYRFFGHPSLELKVDRAENYYEVHKKAFEHFREKLPDPESYYLAPFSLKKRSNIYGIIFGSAHPKGMDKFMEVAWKQDEINGAANFDINRDSISPTQPYFALQEFRPTKVTEFDRELEAAVRDGRLEDELQVVKFCFSHGMRRKHAEPVLKKLKQAGVISPNFRVPNYVKRPPRRLR